MIKVWERNGRLDGLFVVVHVLCVCNECVWTTRNSEQSQIGPPYSGRIIKNTRSTKRFNKKKVLVISCQPQTALIADY
jgi:hypothetical protein